MSRDTSSFLGGCAVAYHECAESCATRNLFMRTSSSSFPRQLQSEQNTHETLSRFSSDPREFFRVGNDANRLDLPLLHLNAQDGECFFASADDKGCLAVDFL